MDIHGSSGDRVLVRLEGLIILVHEAGREQRDQPLAVLHEDVLHLPGRRCMHRLEECVATGRMEKIRLD